MGWTRETHHGWTEPYTSTSVLIVQWNYFKAEPTGTFWYHSHRVTQRVDGLFGALIVLESTKSRLLLQSALGVPLIVDSPGNQTLNLYEWNERSALGYYTLKGSTRSISWNTTW